MAVLPLQRDSASAEFFDATARKELLLRQCLPHQHWSPPAAMRCLTCGSADLTWKPCGGRGRIATWALVHGDPRSGGTGPIAVALVELDEGPWLPAQVITSSPNISTGMAVGVSFDRADGGEAVPVFAPLPTPEPNS